MKLIVAYDSHRGIGKSKGIPWKISDDMKNFKKIYETPQTLTKQRYKRTMLASII